MPFSRSDTITFANVRPSPDDAGEFPVAVRPTRFEVPFADRVALLTEVPAAPMLSPTMSTVVSVEALTSFTKAVLETQDVPPDDASVVAECLVFANRSGVDTHGVVRLAHYIRRLQNGSIATRPELTIARRAPALASVDGGDGLGHVVSHRACIEAIDIARDQGSAFVVVSHSSHMGMLGYYMNLITEHGMAGMVMTTTDAFLVPFGGTRPFFGTNPLCMAVPGPDIPVVLDMATTSIPYGKVALAKVEGRSIPESWGVDGKGKPTTDPGELVGLHPIAGPKGSGIAMMIDVFCSLIMGLPFGPHIVKMYGDMEQPRNLGHVFAVWDITRFGTLDEFRNRVGEMIDELHAMPPAEGFDRVLFPGELEGLRRSERGLHGIPIEEGLADELRELGESVGVRFPAQ